MMKIIRMNIGVHFARKLVTLHTKLIKNHG